MIFTYKLSKADEGAVEWLFGSISCLVSWVVNNAGNSVVIQRAKVIPEARPQTAGPQTTATAPARSGESTMTEPQRKPAGLQSGAALREMNDIMAIEGDYRRRLN